MSQPIVLGATTADQINYGETIDKEIAVTDTDGNAIDLSAAEISIPSSRPASLKDHAEITVVDAEAGLVRFYLSAEHALLLGKGRVNRFRLRTVYGPESVDTTDEIWVQIT